MNKLKALSDFGQSPWLDFIRRDMLISGELERQIMSDGLKGLTSNPAIFEKALLDSDEYNLDIQEMGRVAGLKTKDLAESIMVKDIQLAADAFLPVYTQSEGKDGFVSLEVSPFLAHDYIGTVSEAKRLWDLVNRPNLMIKVPGTQAGIQALESLISSGISVNVTLLFSKDTYVKVAETYVKAIEARSARGENISKVASVASFFISRIDAAVDKLLFEKAEALPSKRENSEKLLGKIAIANAKAAYRSFQELFGTPEFQELEQKGAQRQRLLWASTGTKNPEYKETLYVDELIGPQTVNTLPPATIEAFNIKGTLGRKIDVGLEEAQGNLKSLSDLGIQLEDVTDRLLRDGIRMFEKAFDGLFDTLEQKRKSLL